MKSHIAAAHLLKLLPENDADKALLNHWSDGQCGIASHCYSEGQTLSILLQFRPRPDAAAPTIPLKEILNYEIRASWWPAHIHNRWLQELAGKYFAWKTRRKFRRWEQSRLESQRVKHQSASVASAVKNS